MKYIVFPSEKLDEIPSIMTLPLLDEEEKTENPIYPYPTYEGEELSVLLSGPDWSSNESII